MARIRSKQSALKTLSCKFGGMGKHTPLSPSGAEDMCNFRILPNGALRVRSGYALKKHFAQGSVRGFWEGSLEGTTLSFAVVNNTVYRLSSDGMTETAVGTINTGTENVHLFVYEDTLYLLDGKDIWNYSSSSNRFRKLEPYVPLFGYAWSPSSYGDINEEINLLTPRLRMHYYNSEGVSEFRLPYYADSVEIVRANGVVTTNYNFSRGSNKITFSSPPTVLEVGFTVALNEDVRASILAAQMSYIYTHNGMNQLFLWGKDPRLFYAKNVDDNMLSSCHVLYPNASSLYIGMDNVFFLGDDTHPITTVCPLHESLLVFTSDRIWNLSFEEEEMQVTLASRDMGCSSLKGAIPYDNGVLTATNGGIYHLKASSSQPEDLSIERISVGIDDKFPAAFTDNVHLVRNFAMGEIWMRDPADTTGEVWVWNTELKEWYRFSGVAATLFFKNNNDIGFACGNDLFVFDRSNTTDNGSPINAYYKSAYLDFGVPDSIRRSMRAFLYTAPNKNDCEISFETERREDVYQLSTPLLETSPQLHDMRLFSHRHRFLRFTLSTSAKHVSEFYRLDIYSRP